MSLFPYWDSNCGASRIRGECLGASSAPIKMQHSIFKMALLHELEVSELRAARKILGRPNVFGPFGPKDPAPKMSLGLSICQESI